MVCIMTDPSGRNYDVLSDFIWMMVQSKVMPVPGKRGERKVTQDPGCLLLAQAGLIRGEVAGVDGHAHGGVHADFFEGAHFAEAANSAGGGDGQLGDAAQLAEPGEVRALHRAFVVHKRGEEFGAVGLERRNDVGGAQFKAFPPAAHDDASALGIERDDDAFSSHALRQAAQKSAIHLAVAERCAAHDDFLSWGAEKIIVGSAAFRDGQVDRAFLRRLAQRVGRKRVIVALDT